MGNCLLRSRSKHANVIDMNNMNKPMFVNNTPFEMVDSTIDGTRSEDGSHFEMGTANDTSRIARIERLLQHETGPDVNAREDLGETTSDISRHFSIDSSSDSINSSSVPSLDSLQLLEGDDTRTETGLQYTTQNESFIESLQMGRPGREPASASGVSLQSQANAWHEGFQSQPRSASNPNFTGHQIHSSEISVRERLGGGSFGRVHRALWKGVEVAVKIIVVVDHMGLEPTQGQGMEQKLFEERVIPEVEMLSTLRHPFVVQYFGCCVDPPMIVMELCPMGSLSHLLQRCSCEGLGAKMTWRRRLCMARQIASALQYLHGLPMRGGMLHRDLRTMNVVVTSDWTTKLTDVGMSKFVDQVSSRSAGTLGGHNPRWMAPEILREGPFTKASDVYGLGTILWELMVWQHPWENMHPVQVVFARTSSDLEVPPETEWDSLPGPRPLHEDTLPRFAALAARCLSVDPSTRPPISEIVDLLSEMEEQEPNTDSQAPTATQQHSRQQADLQVCCVCLHNSPTMIMPKCFHLCLCEQCAGRPIKECPICRRAGAPQRVHLS